MNIYNYESAEGLVSTNVMDWDSVSCDLELVKPLYYYRWNDQYIYDQNDMELPKVEDPEECGFSPPQKDLYYNDWNDDYEFKDGQLDLP